jgi:UDP-glucose 4-epimerase
MQKKILVTGCSGYIGSHLCEMLEDNYDVLGFDMVDPLFPMKNFVNGTIFSVSDLRKLKRHGNFDAIVHLAALVRVGESEKVPDEYYLTNTFGTLQVLDEINTPHFIFASTGAAELGNSPYARSKRAAEDIVNQAAGGYTIFRFYNVIGTDGFPPTNPDGLMHKLVEAAAHGEFTIHGNDYEESHDGTPIRDYVHVNEICNSIITAIESKPTNTIECLGHGKGYSVKEIVDLFKKTNDIDFTVKYGPRRPGDAPITVLKDVSRFMVQKYDIKDLLCVDTGS